MKFLGSGAVPRGAELKCLASGTMTEGAWVKTGAEFFAGCGATGEEAEAGITVLAAGVDATPVADSLEPGADAAKERLATGLTGAIVAVPA